MILWSFGAIAQSESEGSGYSNIEDNFKRLTYRMEKPFGDDCKELIEIEIENSGLVKNTHHLSATHSKSNGIQVGQLNDSLKNVLLEEISLYSWQQLDSNQKQTKRSFYSLKIELADKEYYLDYTQNRKGFHNLERFIWSMATRSKLKKKALKLAPKDINEILELVLFNPYSNEDFTQDSLEITQSAYNSYIRDLGLSHLRKKVTKSIHEQTLYIPAAKGSLSIVNPIIINRTYEVETEQADYLYFKADNSFIRVNELEVFSGFDFWGIDDLWRFKLEKVTNKWEQLDSQDIVIIGNPRLTEDMQNVTIIIDYWCGNNCRHKFKFYLRKEDDECGVLELRKI